MAVGRLWACGRVGLGLWRARAQRAKRKFRVKMFAPRSRFSGRVRPPIQNFRVRSEIIFIGGLVHAQTNSAHMPCVAAGWHTGHRKGNMPLREPTHPSQRPRCTQAPKKSGGALKNAKHPQPKNSLPALSAPRAAAASSLSEEMPDASGRYVMLLLDRYGPASVVADASPCPSPRPASLRSPLGSYPPWEHLCSEHLEF